MLITLAQNITIPETEIKVVNLVQESITHPVYKVPCIKHMVKERKPFKHASLGHPNYTKYITAQYKFLNPETNKYSYFTPPLPNVTGIKRKF